MSVDQRFRLNPEKLRGRWKESSFNKQFYEQLNRTLARLMEKYKRNPKTAK